MKKKKRELNYPDFNLECDVCHEHFRTPQGLQGHKRMRHSVIASEAKQPLAAGAAEFSGGPSLKALRQEVDELKLLSAKRKLQAELLPAGSKPLDMMESAGLGGFDPEVRAGIQRRALGMEQKRNETWLDKILTNPEGLKVAVDALKGILGVDRNHDDSLSLLKELGFNLKDLVTQAQSPRAGSDLEVGGVNLRGAVLTPDLLIALLRFREAEETAKAKVQAEKELNEWRVELIEKAKPMLRELIDAFKSSRFGGISQEIFNPEVNVLKCPSCGFENQLLANIKPGDVIHCGGENCEQSWIAENIQAEQKARKTVKHEIRVKPAEPTVINCPNCNQAVDVTDKPLGSVIACPGCEQEFKITSDSIAMPAAEPLPKSEEDEKPLSRGARRSRTAADLLSG